MWTPEERWDRVAKALMWTAILFGVFAAYGIYDGDDWRGVVMTIAPGALVGVLAYLAAARRDHLINDTPSSIGEKVGMIAALAVLGTLVGFYVLEREERQERIEERAYDRATTPIKLPDDIVPCERESVINGKKVMLTSICRKGDRL